MISGFSYEFRQVVRHLPLSQLEGLIQKVHSKEVEAASKEFRWLVRTVKRDEPPFDHAFFLRRDISYVALAALGKGDISLSEFTFHQLYTSERDRIGRQMDFVPLKSKVAEKLLSQVDVKQLRDAASEASSMEQGLFVYPDPRILGKTITAALKNIDFNYFFSCPQSKLGLIAPHFWVQKYFHLKFGDRQIAPLPAIGFISEKNLVYDQLRGVRTCALPFEGLEQKSAHTFHVVTGKELHHHDIYHAYLLSLIGPEFAKRYLAIAEIIGEILPAAFPVDALKSYFYDMEIFLFRPELRQKVPLFWDGTESLDELFWHGVAKGVVAIVTEEFRKSEVTQVLKELHKARFFRELKKRLPYPGLEEAYNRVQSFSKQVISKEIAEYEYYTKNSRKLFLKKVHPLQFLAD